MNEYLPAGAAVEATAADLGSAPRGVGVAISNVRAAGRSDVSFEVASADGSGVVVVPWYRYPGWKVALDGRAAPLVPESRGLISFRVPPGRHVARVHFGTTPPRVIGWLLCGASLFTLGALALRRKVT